MKARPMPRYVKALARDSASIEFWRSNDLQIGARLSHFSLANAWNRLERLVADDHPEHFISEVFEQVLSLEKRWQRLQGNPARIIDANIAEANKALHTAANILRAHLNDICTKQGGYQRSKFLYFEALARQLADDHISVGTTEDYLLRPIKMAEKNAFRTFCVKAMTYFLRQNLGVTDNGVVADITSAALDIRDGSLNADFVEKLTRTIYC